MLKLQQLVVQELSSSCTRRPTRQTMTACRPVSMEKQKSPSQSPLEAAKSSRTTRLKQLKPRDLLAIAAKTCWFPLVPYWPVVAPKIVETSYSRAGSSTTWELITSKQLFLLPRHGKQLERQGGIFPSASKLMNITGQGLKRAEDGMGNAVVATRFDLSLIHI